MFSNLPAFVDTVSITEHYHNELHCLQFTCLNLDYSYFLWIESEWFVWPSCEMILLTFWFLVSWVIFGLSLRLALNMRFSLTVRVPITTSSCTTYPEISWKLGGVGSPSNITSPSTPTHAINSIITGVEAWADIRGNFCKKCWGV